MMKPRLFKIAQVMMIRFSQARDSSTVRPDLEKFIRRSATAAVTTAAIVLMPRICVYTSCMIALALVLAIGTVVDDAIVVVEAVQAKFDAGYKSPYEATKDAMSDVTMAVISCTFVFMAVFIPVSFMPGTSGIFYTQFGVTLATSVGLSCVSALVLCPALCAMMMRPASEERRKGILGTINYRTRLAYEASYEAMR